MKYFLLYKTNPNNLGCPFDRLFSPVFSLISTSPRRFPFWIPIDNTMPRQQINLEPYRDEIIALFQHGISSDSISRTLESRYNIQVKERTIQSRLRKWGIRKRSRTTTADETLHARIKVLFVQDRLTDKAMLKLLRQDGYDISERTLRRLRFQLGLHARASLEHDRSPMHLPLPVPIQMPVSAPVTVIAKGRVEAWSLHC